ncbi:MAG: nucleotidyltransferase domain-containing protein [Ruminococcaceae bacterium]|nr:nucleotidyltransferase domain-containing protein [Oscillospiraceae bacterium]
MPDNSDSEGRAFESHRAYQKPTEILCFGGFLRFFGGDNVSEKIYTQEEIAACVIPLLQKYHAERAVLFGSYARGEATRTSDVDLVIIGGAEFDPTDVFSIADELFDRLGKNVDVYELREINEGTDFYNAIFSEGVQIA